MAAKRLASLRDEGEESPKSQILEHSDEVANAVLKQLGTPNNFANIRATLVWPDWYRVNVRTVKEQRDLISVTQIEYSYLVKYKDGKLCGGDEVVNKY